MLTPANGREVGEVAIPPASMRGTAAIAAFRRPHGAACGAKLAKLAYPDLGNGNPLRRLPLRPRMEQQLKDRPKGSLIQPSPAAEAFYSEVLRLMAK